jgi:polyisoprenoid-binding protein YceI
MNPPTAAPDHRDADVPFGMLAGTWLVDPAESDARFEAATLWGRVPVAGRLGEAHGRLDWDGASGTGELAIATRGVETGISLRDRHLRSREFFHAAKHPEVHFSFTQVVAESGKLRLGGTVGVRGLRHPFACMATVVPSSDDRVVIEAIAAFDLDELRMSRGRLNMIPPAVTAAARITLRREAP